MVHNSFHRRRVGFSLRGISWSSSSATVYCTSNTSRMDVTTHPRNEVDGSSDGKWTLNLNAFSTQNGNSSNHNHNGLSRRHAHFDSIHARDSIATTLATAAEHGTTDETATTLHHSSRLLPLSLSSLLIVIVHCKRPGLALLESSTTPHDIIDPSLP